MGSELDATAVDPVVVAQHVRISNDPPAWIVAWAEASRFLVDEAALLDTHDLEGWLSMLSHDIEYTAPVRSTRYRNADADHPGADEFSTTSFHFDDDIFSLRMRVARLGTRFAWAEDPPTRTRHLVANVSAETRPDGGLDVVSDVLVHRSRLDEPTVEVLTARREDWLERDRDRLRLRRRRILVDATSLPLSTISTFL